MYQKVGFCVFRMVSDPENPLVLNILHASSTAYSHSPVDKIEEVCNCHVLLPASCSFKTGKDQHNNFLSNFSLYKMYVPCIGSLPLRPL